MKSIVLTLTALAALLAFSSSIQAHPYASGVTGTNGSGDVSFTMNEAGATVTVEFEDTSTLPLGVLPKGPAIFNIGAHTSFKIICYKQGSGTPTLISTDADTYSIWNSPRGVAVNKNAAIGTNFGRLVVGNSTPGSKAQGLFLLNADQTLVKGPVGTSFYALGGANGPWRVRANADGTFLVNDFSTANANLLQYSPDLSSSNLVLSIIGQTAAAAAGIHGDFFGCAIMKGSIAGGDLVLYTFDSGMGAPGDTNCILGPLTSPGSYNNVYRYNIGSGPLPWNKRPDYAYTMGLDGIAGLRTEGDVGNDGKVYCAFGRANASNPNLQILRPLLTTNGITGDIFNQMVQDAAKSPTNWLYTGGVTPPFNLPPNGAANDPWAGSKGSGVNGGTYAGVRISPDGKLIASVDINNGATIANLTNGIPNEGTIFGIANAPSTGNARGMDWDPANNLWIASSGQGLLRCYSLGQTTTCVTSNDWTGTNGTFQLITPASTASLAATTPTASQNYTNNTINPGAPIPGVFSISFFNGEYFPSSPATKVGFVRSGTAVLGVNYILNTNETPSGVVISNDFVIFPAGIPFGGFASVGVKIIPTATPVSGPTLDVNFRLTSGTNYSTLSPSSGTVAILNTGPQLIQLSAAAPATLGGMNRGIANDQARFVITRLGDLNGPGNDSITVVPKTLTLTNFNYLNPASGGVNNIRGKATLGVDYTAGAQSFTGSAPVDGSPGIAINPGVVTLTAMIGNPVKHTNTSLSRSNLAVLINLTNTVAIGSPASTTNAFSQEGNIYSVAVNSLTLNEFDNAVGGEVVLWSNPLTNSFDSTNWTVVYAGTSQDSSPTLPTVTSNYNNSYNVDGFDYLAAFGNDVAADSVPQSSVMTANNWTSALKVSVNKNPGNSSEAGVNLYPQIPGAPGGTNYMVFQGNYALRFDMYLHLYDFGLNNPTIGTPAREFAAFGINHQGTNANWRLDINPRADGTGARPVNADGEWCSIGAASGSITPADYDMFISPPWIVPIYNEIGINTNQQPIPFTSNFFIGTNTAVVSSGQLIQVPYTNAYQYSPGNYSGVTNVFNNGGVPNDQVSANNNAFGGAAQNGIIKNPPFSGINANGGAPANAWVEVSLELSRQTNLSLKVAQQEIFKSSILLPTAGAQNPLAPYSGTPMLGYLDPNRNISDYSAYVYYSNIRVVELSPFIPWTNQPVAGLIVTQGASFSLSSGATFASNPLTNTWYVGTTNGPVSIASPFVRENGTPTAGVTTNVFNTTNGLTTLTVNSIQSGTNYISVWSDQAGSVTNFISVIEVVPAPGNKTVLLGGTTNFTVVPSGNAPPTSYQWMFYDTNLVNSAHYAGVTTATLWITNVAAADAGAYSNVVANANGSVVVAGTLNVLFGYPPYEFSSAANLASTVALSFTTANPADTSGSFTLQSAGLVTGPYTNNPFGVFSGSNPNFIVTVPKTNTMLYFRLKHN